MAEAEIFSDLLPQNGQQRTGMSPAFAEDSVLLNSSLGSKSLAGTSKPISNPGTPMVRL